MLCFFAPTNLQLITPPDPRFYRLGYSGYIIADIPRYFVQLAAMWIVFALILRKFYLCHKEEIKRGEKWMLRMGYTFFYGVMIKVHESMFGLTFYMLLL